LKEFTEDLGIDLIRLSENFSLKKYFESKIENQAKYPKRKREEYKEGGGKEVKIQNILLHEYFATFKYEY